MKDKLLPALLLFVIFGFCTGCGDDDKRQESFRSVRVSESVRPVETVRSAIRPFNHFIVTSAKVQASAQVILFAHEGGVIKDLRVKNGANVKYDQLLAVFDTDALQLKIRKTRSNLQSSKIEFQSELMGYGGSAAVLVDSVIEHLRYTSGLIQAELTLQEQLMELERSKLAAPFSGKIADLRVKSGWTVKAGDELMTIYSDRSLVALIKVLESDVNAVRIGQQAIFFPLSDSTSSVLAQVEEINPLIDENGMAEVKVSILNPTGLMPGMSGDVRLRVLERKCLTVPKNAVVKRGGKNVVFTVRKGAAQWNYVTTGEQNGDEIEIKTGLKVDLEVIITNNLQLSDGTPVTARIVKNKL